MDILCDSCDEKRESQFFDAESCIFPLFTLSDAYSFGM